MANFVCEGEFSDNEMQGETTIKDLDAEKDIEFFWTKSVQEIDREGKVVSSLVAVPSFGPITERELVKWMKSDPNSDRITWTRIRRHHPCAQ